MMRDYAKVAPQFWTGHTGRKLRGNPDMQIITMYLVTCPSSSMTGIYYLPVPTISFETGIPVGRVRTALKRLDADGVAMYDEEASLIYVPNMARFQVGETLKTKDNRVPWIIKELAGWRSHPFVKAFWRAYEGAYGLGEWPWNPLARPFEAPSDPLRSQEQEQDQEQEQEQEQDSQSVSLAGNAPPAKAPKARQKAKAAPEYPLEFNHLWAETGRSGNKLPAFEAWIARGSPTADAVIEGWRHAERHDRRWKGNDPHIPHLASWLNDRGWEDRPMDTNPRMVLARLTVAQIETRDREERERKKLAAQVEAQDAAHIRAVMRGEVTP